MFKLKQLRPEGGDCTAPYDVILDKEYTLEEFVKTVVSRDDEWGEIRVDIGRRSYFDNPYCEYKWGELLSVLPDDLIYKKIISVKAHGGWSAMNYFITVND